MKCFVDSKDGCIIQDETVIVPGATAVIALIAAPVLIETVLALPAILPK